MGYSIHRFLTPVDPNLLCGICSSVLEDAVVTPCGHTFCRACVQTWLERPGTRTCPECRGSVPTASDVKPVLALRNLINGFDIDCEFSERGCKIVVKLDQLKRHSQACGYGPVRCAGCDITVNRLELAAHQIQCEGIAATLREDLDSELLMGYGLTRNGSTSSNGSDQVSGLLCRMASLEFQLKSVKRQLQIAESKNRILEREYKKVQTELQHQRAEILDLQYNDADSAGIVGDDPQDQEIDGTTATPITTVQEPQTIARLSLFIGKHLLSKPTYVDKDRMFSSVRRCYEQFSRSGDEHEQDVHMLVATAFASNWFSDEQRLSFHCWLQSIARFRQYNYSGVNV